MSTQTKTKKKEASSVWKFSNVSGEPLVLETRSLDSTSCFVVERVTDENVLQRTLCFVSLLILYVVLVRLGLVDGWYCFPVFGFGIVGLLGTVNKVVQGEAQLRLLCVGILLFSESLLVVENLGLQIDIKYIVGSRSVFVPNDIIKGIFINEVISRVSTSQLPKSMQ